MITKHRLKVAAQTVIYFVLVVLLLHEIDEATRIEECTGFDAPPKAVARGDYDFLIRHSTFREASNQKVVEVVINTDSDPKEVVTNYCTQREFTARVIDRLNELLVSVIALDKIYMRERCSPNDIGTNKLQEAIRRSRATIVRGLDTEIMPETRVDNQNVCLRMKPGSYLSLDVAGQNSGLLRMDANTKLAPLAWPIQIIEENGDSRIEKTPTFSFVTARAAEPQAVQTRLIQKAIRSHQQPYTTRVVIPIFSAAQILCGPTYTSRSDWRSCNSREELRELRNAVVLFGTSGGGDDWHKEVNRPQGLYGIDLQANYIAAILDQRCYMPLLSPKCNLVFIGCVLLILHLCFHFFKPLWIPVVIAFGVWVLMVLISILIVSHLGYLFTVWVQGITFTTIAITALHHWDTTDTT